MTRILIVSGVLLLFGNVALADPIKFMAAKSHLSVDGTIVNFQTEVPYSFSYPTSEKTGAEGEGGRLQFVTDYFRAHFFAEQNTTPCSISVGDIVIDEQAPNTVFRGHVTCPEEINNIDSLKISSTLFLDLFQDVDHFVMIELGSEKHETLLSSKNKTYQKETAGIPTFGVGFFSILKLFAGLGVEHILFGFDHVLFLLAVHSLVRKFKDIVAVVTAFTIAHSITLILASLQVINISAKIVDPIVAFSIAYTAFRNIVIQKNGLTEERIMKERWTSTFGFGLVHGLGFASALTGIKIPSAYFLPALLSFNVGVEAGQMIIIGLFVSLLFLIKKLGFLKEAIYAISVIVGFMSLIWMAQGIGLSF